MTISKSPGRGTFQKDAYIDRCKENGEEPSESYLEMYQSFIDEQEELEKSDTWKENNLEYDLRSTDWILEKVRASEAYAQNLYAAMCNMQWQQNKVWPLLKDQRYSCSWRYAGGIIADMREEGDYIDWYCSGIKGSMSDEEYHGLDKESQERYLYMKNNFVGEGVVTDEIQQDLLKLGWVPVEYEDDA